MIITLMIAMFVSVRIPTWMSWLEAGLFTWAAIRGINKVHSAVKQICYLKSV